MLSQAKSESTLEDEDEWTAIQKFNALLHYEEQKQAAKREQERRRLLKEELDNQHNIKQQKIKALKDEAMEYDKALNENLKVQDEKEAEKVKIT